MANYDLRPAVERAVTRTDWVLSAHSFSAGPHYDPANLGFGPLIAHNEDLLQPGPGYTWHRHRDTEILTWVIAGCLLHRDEAGREQQVRPGMVQLLSAGSGINHAERSAVATEPVHLVQMWLSPSETGTAPSYGCAEVSEQLAGGGLVLLASGEPGQSPLRLRRPAATLSAARLPAGGLLRLPAAARSHLFLATGSGQLAPVGRLAAGDAVRITGGQDEQFSVDEPAELLLWQLPE